MWILCCCNMTVLQNLCMNDVMLIQYIFCAVRNFIVHPVTVSSFNCLAFRCDLPLLLLQAWVGTVAGWFVVTPFHGLYYYSHTLGKDDWDLAHILNGHDSLVKTCIGIVNKWELSQVVFWAEVLSVSRNPAVISNMATTPTVAVFRMKPLRGSRCWGFIH